MKIVENAYYMGDSIYAKAVVFHVLSIFEGWARCVKYDEKGKYQAHQQHPVKWLERWAVQRVAPAARKKC